MRIFNRIVMVLFLAGLTALGIAMIVYAFDAGEHRLSNLPRALGLSGIYEGLNNFASNAEGGSLNPLDVTVLVAIALVGLILLVLELKPPSPRLVRMQPGTYITRGAVENEAVTAAEQGPEVLEAGADVDAQRKPGAKVNVAASVRRGEDTRRLQSGVRDRVQTRLAEVGVPVSNLKVRVVEADPRETKTRVN
jgi:hypothetical protein